MWESSSITSTVIYLSGERCVTNTTCINHKHFLGKHLLFCFFLGYYGTEMSLWHLQFVFCHSPSCGYKLFHFKSSPLHWLMSKCCPVQQGLNKPPFHCTVLITPSSLPVKSGISRVMTFHLLFIFVWGYLASHIRSGELYVLNKYFQHQGFMSLIGFQTKSVRKEEKGGPQVK